MLNSSAMRNYDDDPRTYRWPSQSSTSPLLPSDSYSSIGVTTNRRSSADTPTNRLPYSDHRTPRRSSNGNVPTNFQTNIPKPRFAPWRKATFDLGPTSTYHEEPIDEIAVFPESYTDRIYKGCTALQTFETPGQRFNYTEHGQRPRRILSDPCTCTHCVRTCGYNVERYQQSPIYQGTQSYDDELDADVHGETRVHVENDCDNTVKAGPDNHIGEKELLQTTIVSTSTSDKESQQTSSKLFVSKQLCSISIIIVMLSVVISTCVILGLHSHTSMFNNTDEYSTIDHVSIRVYC